MTRAAAMPMRGAGLLRDPSSTSLCSVVPIATDATRLVIEIKDSKIQKARS